MFFSRTIRFCTNSKVLSVATLKRSTDNMKCKSDIPDLWCYIPQDIKDELLHRSLAIIDTLYSENKEIDCSFERVNSLYDKDNFMYEDNFVILNSLKNLPSYLNFMSKWITLEYQKTSNIRIHPRLVGSERNCFRLIKSSSLFNSSAKLMQNKCIVAHQAFLELNISYKINFTPFFQWLLFSTSESVLDSSGKSGHIENNYHKSTQAEKPSTHMLIISFNDDLLIIKQELKCTNTISSTKSYFNNSQIMNNLRKKLLTFSYL